MMTKINEYGLSIESISFGMTCGKPSNWAVRGEKRMVNFIVT
jgi:hypothetical protein